MSIPVALADLRAALDERPAAAYLLTVANDGRPHAVHVAICWDGDRLAAPVGARTASNAAARPDAVALIFPVRSPDDYSLIVDAHASVTTDAGERRVLLAPSKAVLHRPAAVPEPDAACAADCVPLLTPEDRTRR